MKKAVQLLVSGTVQGVGFRYYVNRSARQNRVAGWVKNLEDGRVEIFAQADEKDLDAFIRDMRKGSRFSTVSDVQVEPQSVDPHFREFRIIG